MESIVEAERLRRQAASANALRLASSLHDITAETSLEPLVEAMAALPNAIGATVLIEHPVVGAPLELAVPLGASLGLLNSQAEWPIGP